MVDKKVYFIVIEGLDGSGKSEMARRLANILENKYSDNFLLTNEPHIYSCAGIFIRQVLSKRRKADDWTIALAFAANRLDHSRNVITKFLNEGRKRNRVVICDRYYLSSLVYQSGKEKKLQLIR